MLHVGKLCFTAHKQKIGLIIQQVYIGEGLVLALL